VVAAMLNLGEVPKGRDGCDDQHGTKYASEHRESKTRVHNSAYLKTLGLHYDVQPTHCQSSIFRAGVTDLTGATRMH
jgi:hypothetical protein